MASEWPAEKKERLRQLWAEGHSIREIGRRMNISHCAVAGKVGRLNLPARGSPIRPRAEGQEPPVPGGRRQAVREIVRVDRAILEAPKPVFRPTPCCWPIGEVGKPGFHFCGARSEPGRPYCGEHCAVAYVGVRRKDAV